MKRLIHWMNPCEGSQPASRMYPFVLSPVLSILTVAFRRSEAHSVSVFVSWQLGMLKEVQMKTSADTVS